MAKKVTKKSSKKKTAAKKAVRKSARKVANHGRAPGKTQISISLPTELIERIDRLAAAQNRNRSNFIANELDKIGE